MARGLQQPGKVYKLKKSLYGLKQAPRNFFNHLRENLEAVGFEQQIEIDTLKKMDVWEIVDCEPWMNVLPSVMVFRKKVFPNGTMRKLKARLCAGGHRQIEGVDYFETYAPVVNWNTVRLLLIIAAQMELATRQVDYTAAFAHAPIDKHRIGIR